MRLTLLAAALLAGLGLAGTASPAAAQSYGVAMYTAMVGANGVINRSNGVTAAGRTATGHYFVEFSRPVAQKCSFQATLFGNQSGQAQITGSGIGNRIFVFTFNQNGQPANRFFSLFVYCTP